MRLLLDTHLLLWVISEPAKLSPLAREVIGEPENELYFSVASIWEVAIKQARQREDFDVDPYVLRRELFDNLYQELPISGEHAAATANLPRLHRDPFDRLLVAQSIVEGITLLTSDPRVAQYPGPVRQV